MYSTQRDECVCAPVRNPHYMEDPRRSAPTCAYYSLFHVQIRTTEREREREGRYEDSPPHLSIHPTKSRAKDNRKESQGKSIRAVAAEGFARPGRR